MRTKIIAILAVAAGLLVLAVNGAIAALAGPASELAGLWEAHLAFGPAVKGELVIERGGDSWRGMIAGAHASAPASEAIALDFGDGRGRFQGRFDGRSDAIEGHWVQPRAGFNGTVYATPVHFTGAGSSRWRGEVQPLNDALTLYLKLEAGADGTVHAFMRNPERNVGAFVKLTRVVRDGATVRLMGMQGDREVEAVTGSYDPVRDTMSFPIPPLGGTFLFRRAVQGSAFYPRGSVPGQQAWRAPVRGADGWEIATPEGSGLARPAVESFLQKLVDTKIDSVHALDIHAFLLARHGRLVVDEYFHGFDGQVLHDTRSASKSVTAVIAGAAERAGLGVSAGTPVYAAMNGGVEPAGLEARRRAMKLEHLLTMASGLACDDSNGDSPGNEDVMQNQDKESDWYRYTLALPMVAEPGGASVYCSGGTNLAGGVTSRVARQSLLSLFERLVAKPLGIKRYAVNLMPQGEAYGGGGIHIAPRDFLKIGQMMLNGGRWKGQQVLDEAWVARATSPLKTMREVRYGYLWWVTDLKAPDGRIVRAIYAGGNGGQVLMILPELDMVVAFFGGNYGDPVFYVPQREYVPKYVLQMVVLVP